MLNELLLASYNAYIVVDGYYAAGKIVKGLLSGGNELITRARSNAVAYQKPKTIRGKGKRGRPRKYGKKIRLKNLFRTATMSKMQSPVYGEGRIILLSSDVQLSPQKIIQLYGYLFKIEVSFKQAVHTMGTSSYHFWMKNMDPLKNLLYIGIASFVEFVI